MRFLSPEWCEALPDRCGPVPVDDAVFHLKTEGGPEGKTAHRFTVAGGSLDEVAAGSARGADVELTVPYDLAAELLGGDADAVVEFMRGTLKMSGDMGIWLRLLPELGDGGLARAAEPVVADTEF